MKVVKSEEALRSEAQRAEAQGPKGQGVSEVLGDKRQLAPCPPTRRSGGAV